MRTPSTWRSTAVLGLAAFTLHQLVYLVSFGAGAGHALQGRGHAYLSFAGPLLAVLALCAIAASLMAARRGGTNVPGGRTGSWLLWSLLLLAIFLVQETTESLLATGGVGDVTALLQHVAGLPVLAAAAIGRLVTTALTGLTLLERGLARRPTGRRARAPRRGRAAGRVGVSRLLAGPAVGLAPRPPPPPPGLAFPRPAPPATPPQEGFVASPPGPFR